MIEEVNQLDCQKANSKNGGDTPIERASGVVED